MPGNYGDILAQKVNKRLYFAVANEAALASIPSNELIAGRLYPCISEGSIWMYSGSAFQRTAGAGSGGLYTCATGVAAGEWVYISAANTVAEADADDAAKRPAIGVVVAKPSTTSCFVQTAGEYTTTGLTAGAAYYLSAATAGVITATPPAGNVQLVGWAKSTTVLVITPQVEAFNLSSTSASLGLSLLGLQDAGGLYAASNGEAAFLEVLTKAAVRRVRGVSVTNVADLGAFVVANNGITYVEGDRILLAAQSTGAQNGVYVVGVVDGTAPLTRAADMPAGLALPLGSIVETGPEGTEYKSSSWKATATTTGGAVIGTNDPLFYPRVYRQTITLASGTYKIGFGSTATPDESLYLLSTTTSTVNITRDTVGGTVTDTIMYACPVTTRVAGTPGTANIVINAVVAAGTIQNQDNSTLSVLVTNW